MKIDKYDKFLIDTYKDLNTYRRQSPKYDIFISAFTNEESIELIYSNTEAARKIWLVMPEYKDIDIGFETDLEIYRCETCRGKYKEIEFIYIDGFIKQYSDIDWESYTICIDISGFVKPYLIYLILALQQLGSNKVDFVYSEPKIYKNQENTKFSAEETEIVRPIVWDDVRAEVGKNDLLLLNAGYDHKLIINVANKLTRIKRKILLGFPSLQPTMFQENILNFELASDSLGISSTFRPLLASANDPFETAKVLNDYVNQYIEKKEDVKAIYLAPLATKAQLLGMTLFYIYECQRLKEKDIVLKIIYPFTKSYSSDSSKEFFRVNKYSVKFRDY